jgi:hypothetical protein
LDRNYDLFEVPPNGFPVWRAAVTGHENAIRRLLEMSQQTANEVRVMHFPTNCIIAAMNTPKSS